MRASPSPPGRLEHSICRLRDSSLFGKLPKLRVRLDLSGQPASSLREYYDRVGEAGYLQERVDNAIFAYFEEHSERQRLLDQEQIPEPSDEEFEKEFDDRVSDLRRDIQAAKEAAEVLATRCREQGLTIAETPKRPRSRDRISLAPDAKDSPQNYNIAIAKWADEVEPPARACGWIATVSLQYIDTR